MITQPRYVVAVVPYGQTLNAATQADRRQELLNHGFSGTTLGVWSKDPAEFGAWATDWDLALSWARAYGQKAVWIAYPSVDGTTVQGFCFDLFNPADSYATTGKYLDTAPTTNYTRFADCIVG